MNTAPALSPQIREEVLRDPRYPVHKIADQLLPYLQVLVEQFHPEQVILFGSYAYGEPNRDSDVDLLVVKPIQAGRVKDKVAIRRAWWPLLVGKFPLPFDLLLETPAEFALTCSKSLGYHAEILHKGLRVA
jgi:predicted nucleotidyltransferase